MININEISGLPFVQVTVIFKGRSLHLNRVLIDTGSARTIFNVNSGSTPKHVLDFSTTETLSLHSSKIGCLLLLSTVESTKYRYFLYSFSCQEQTLVLSLNSLEEINIRPEANDVTHTIYGIGGTEFVYSKHIDQIYLTRDISISNFLVELGSMDYGLEIDGIIGYDFMKEIGVVIDLHKMNMHL
ncbi:hypothetical protein [Sporosarcina limicola]|uniref:Peptidase A2 domain-containing protein n=1 Tax=Sporosarcina limicola TaxID=34101 RepID=A0A927MFY0_9BACL|nr:hypothetical protein [Sporosarcina limicola]MBE1553913.1 hypothetical protein [Sporosarcina limicola]